MNIGEVLEVGGGPIITKWKLMSKDGDGQMFVHAGTYKNGEIITPANPNSKMWLDSDFTPFWWSDDDP